MSKKEKAAADGAAPEERQGYIYCMTNPSMPERVKVGMTGRTPPDRLREANKSNTFIPEQFVLEFAKRVQDPKKKERAIHNELQRKGLRINTRREFFKCTSAEIRGIFDRIEGEYWEKSAESAPLADKAPGVEPKDSEPQREDNLVCLAAGAISRLLNMPQYAALELEAGTPEEQARLAAERGDVPLMVRAFLETGLWLFSPEK